MFDYDDMYILYIEDSDLRYYNFRLQLLSGNRFRLSFELLWKYRELSKIKDFIGNTIKSKAYYIHLYFNLILVSLLEIIITSMKDSRCVLQSSV
jgi:hypothetical protein